MTRLAFPSLRWMVQFDAVRLVEQKQREIEAALQSTLGLSPKVRLVSPKTIQRSEGKAKRVISGSMISGRKWSSQMCIPVCSLHS